MIGSIRAGIASFLTALQQVGGWIVAHQVNVSAAEISFDGRNAPVQIFAEEILDFPLAFGEGRPTFDLAPGAERFVAVFFADQQLGEAATAQFAFPQTPAGLNS